MAVAITRILVPVDFSPSSDLAVTYATSLAKALGAKVDLLHVVEDPVVTGAWTAEVIVPNLPELLQDLTAEAERRMEECRSRVDAPVTSTVLSGQPAWTIIEQAEALHPDLIVMGTHGRSGLAHFFMGSVAERVVRHAPCPVLTVRAAG